MSPSIIGKVLLDRYRVDTFIASGGMASVYRAWDIKRNVSLAMKVLNADLAEDPAILEKFKREANALKDLSHPNILPFYGLFESEGIFFLLTLFIDGSNLKDIISKAPGKTLPVSEALIYLKATCAALGWAHSKRLVHCDIKPGNVMIDQGGNIFLADFGIARHADSSVTSAAGAGTPAYMSPEQILGEHVSKETDIYSLGVMFYEMVAGRKPFEGRDFNDSKSNATAAERLRDAHIKLIPPDPRKFNPNLPAALSEVILKALNKKPSERYSSTNDFFVAVCKAVGEDESAIPDRTKIPVDSHSGNHVVSQSTSSSNPKQTPSSETKNIPTKVNGKMVIIGGVFLVGIITLLALLIPPKQIPTSVEMTNAIGSELPTISEKKNTVIPIPITETPTTIPTKTPVPSPTTTATATRIPVESMVNPMDNAEMVLIPAGKFWMGSYSGESYLFWGAESPRHEVYLDGYWIYRTEVTNAMYAHCVAEKACPKLAIESTNRFPDYYTNSKYQDYPVVNVNWMSAQSYCVWAKGRLPSEAQWEKAARGDDQRDFPWGDQLPMDHQANYCDVNCSEFNRDPSIDDDYPELAPVGSFPSGASYYSVLDMGGNVTEWVYDWFNAGYYNVSPEENPKGMESGTTRVVRGGSWSDPLEGLQTVVRNYYQPTRAFPYLGFRCVVSQP